MFGKRLIKSNNEGGGASFNTVLYSGTGTAVGTTNTIGGVGFQPDLVWVKSRTNGSFWHNLADSVRGINRRLFSNTTSAEDYDSSGTYNLLSFNNDGFTVGRDNNYNDSGTDNYVAWCWKAGGAAVTIPQGTGGSSMAADVSVNVDAGLSIIKLGTPPSVFYSFAHGLETTPSMFITKSTDAAGSWIVWHQSLGAAPTKTALYLNETYPEGDSGANWIRGMDSTIIEITGGQFDAIDPKIIYAFAEKAGFSKFGSYTGNGSAIGTTVTTGFEPAFVMIKRYDSTGNWVILDNKRDTSNPIDKTLNPNLTAVESTANDIDFNATTFQLKSTNADTNANTGTYIYMAFANQF
jgi:hypothetical protein